MVHQRQLTIRFLDLLHRSAGIHPQNLIRIESLYPISSLTQDQETADKPIDNHTHDDEFDDKPAVDIAVLVVPLELLDLLGELRDVLDLLEPGDVAEGIDDGLADGVGKGQEHQQEDGGVEVISSIVIVLEVLRGVVVPGEGISERHK